MAHFPNYHLHQSQAYQQLPVYGQPAMFTGNTFNNATIFPLAFQPVHNEEIIYYNTSTAGPSHSISPQWLLHSNGAHDIAYYPASQTSTASQNASHIFQTFYASPQPSRDGTYGPSFNETVNNLTFGFTEETHPAERHSDASPREREFRCEGQCGKPNCDATYSSRGGLYRHQLSDEKRYVRCNACGKDVSRQNLARHRTRICQAQAVVATGKSS